MKNNSPHPRHVDGFSLVEISIVIVIIGLLVGGIMTGTSLIDSAKQRSVITDANNYIAAVGNFRSQYRYLPGDMLTAVNYWPTSVNGNGDGQVLGDERFRFWEQLKQADFMDKPASGTTGGGGTNDFIIGTNVPASRFQPAGFSFYYANLTATTVVYTMTLGNMLAFGNSMGSNNGEPINAALTPTEAFKIDNKADDGLPATGNWIANGTGGGAFGTTTACTTSASGTDYTGTYLRTNSAVSCGFFVMTGF